MVKRTRILATFATLVLVLTSGVAYAGAVATATQRALPATHVATPAPAPSPSAPPAVVFGPNHRPLPPLPPMPTGTSSHYRKIKSATGACIVIEVGGNTWNPSCNEAGTIYNTNPTTGTVMLWNAASLPTTGTHTDYYATPTNGNATTANLSQPTAPGPYAGATGTQHTITLSSNGIYVFATLNNTTNTWDAITYILVGPTPDIETYTDGTLSTKTQTYTTNSTGGGVTVYVAATVLDTTDTYMVGIEDQLTGACVFTAPASSQTTITGPPYSLCNLTSSAATGAVPNNNGLINANWAVQLGTSPIPPEGGTYMATIFDQTTGQRVASRQFSIIDGRASAGTARVNLEFNAQGTNAGTSNPYSTRVAWNGTAPTVDDTYYNDMQIYFGGTNLPSTTDSYTLVITDPAGVVEWVKTANTAGTNTITGSSYVFQFSTQSSIPFELAYPGSTWTATIYDATTKKLVAEQAFQVLGYSSRWEWISPTDSTTLNFTTPSQAASLQVTNTADLTFGANNGDPGVEFIGFLAVTGGATVSDITIQGPSNSVPCNPATATGNTCTATYSDSAGNSWNVALSDYGSGSDYIFVVTPTGTTKSLAPGASIDITGLVVSATGCAGTDCQFNTDEIPLDSATPTDPSAYGTVSNRFSITNGAGTIAATASVGVAGYYDSSNTFHSIQDAGYTPRCGTTNANCTSAGVAQSILANNLPFIGAASKVMLAYTVTNTTTGTGNGVAIFDIAPPAGFSIASATLDTAHGGATGTLIHNGSCDGEARDTVCITPSSLITTSQTFDIDFTPPTQSFTYTDLIGTVIQYSIGYSYSGAVAIPMNPTTSSIPTFIGSPSTIDSTAIGAYSLNGGLMTAGVTPTSVGTSTVNNLSFSLRNTTSGADPFPDEVDMVAVQFPSQSYISVPSSCATITTITSGWSCVYTSVLSGVTTYYFGQCPQQDPSGAATVPATSTSFGSDNLPVCPFSLPNEPYSLTAGSTFTATIPVTAGATVTSTPITISSFGHGATTDAWSTPVTSTISVVATASAGAGFSSITGPGTVAGTGLLTATTTGNEPSVTGNYDDISSVYQDEYVYKVKNTSSVGITSVTIAIPSSDTTGSNGADTAGNIWKVIGTPTLTIERTGNSNGCTVGAVSNPASGTSAPGSISITCPSGDFVAGDTLDVTFYAVTPLKINSTYAFTTTVNGSSAAVSPLWTDDEDILIALSATLTVAENNPTSLGGTMVCGGTATPGSNSSTGHAYPNWDTANTLNFGATQNGKFEYCRDAMTVTVTTDASNPTNWSLYATASGNPAATSATASQVATATTPTESTSNELLISMDAANSTGNTTSPLAAAIPCASSTCFTYDNTTFTPIELTGSGTGTRLGYTTNGGTSVNNGPVNFQVNFQVAVGSEASSIPATGYQETITYTWIAN